jgi:hypothetical protein
MTRKPYTVSFNESEEKVLHEVMADWDMSADAVIRHYFRLGQMLAVFLQKGKELGFLNEKGEFKPMIEREPKMAPTQLSCGCDVGVCICDYEKD